MPDVHIIPDGERWSVKEDGGGKSFTHGDEAEFARLPAGDAV